MTAMIFHLSPSPAQKPVPASAGRSGDRPAPTAGFRTVLRQIVHAWHRHRSRAALAELDEASLKDIGVTRAEAEFEANKPLWRV